MLTLTFNNMQLEREVTIFLRKFCIPANIIGYAYIREAIMIAIKDNNSIYNFQKDIYGTISKKHHVTPSKVERGIRYAVEIAWNRCEPDTLKEIFGYTVSSYKGKPTNSEFIAMIADTIRLDLIK